MPPGRSPAPAAKVVAEDEFPEEPTPEEQVAAAASPPRTACCGQQSLLHSGEPEPGAAGLPAEIEHGPDGESARVHNSNALMPDSESADGLGRSPEGTKTAARRTALYTDGNNVYPTWR